MVATALPAQAIAKPVGALATQRLSADGTEHPIVVVGNGPVGMRFAAECLANSPELPLIIYGEESHLPYNRIKLSSWLAGDVTYSDLVQPLRRPFGTHYEERIGYRVDQIDVAGMRVIDNAKRSTRYSTLVLATGSHPYIPPVPGIQAQGVYTLRSVDDAQRLFARRARSHKTVVVGGGLLGLEAARGMQPLNTSVTLIEHADRLMAQQLDEEASAVLENQVRALGIDVILNDGIKQVEASPRVAGITLQSGAHIPCDTVIVATGIVPNITLAQSAGLAYGKGITVNDFMQSSVPSVYAIGECAEHNGQIYGLVAPGFEQATIAARQIAGQDDRYHGSRTVSRLKVVGTSVFSIGPMGETAHPLDGRKVVYEEPKSGVYRALLIKRNKLAGAVGIGAWQKTTSVQSAIEEGVTLYPWNIWRFKRTGDVFADSTSDSVASWPADRTVCHCMGVNRAQLSRAIDSSASSLEDIQKMTSAGTVCGSCQPQINQLLGAGATSQTPRFSVSLLVVSGLAIVSMAIVAAFPGLPYATSVQAPELMGLSLDRHWDFLWRDGFYKQVTGFFLLGLSTLAIVLSLRKRVSLFGKAGAFDIWRLVHVLTGFLTVAVLLVHTGFRVGHGLNQLLMISFSGLIVVGALSSAAISLEDRLGPVVASRIRKHSLWMHILLFLILPVLLAWHVVKGYWY